jgi:hypothetical protein
VTGVSRTLRLEGKWDSELSVVGELFFWQEDSGAITKVHDQDGGNFWVTRIGREIDRSRWREWPVGRTLHSCFRRTRT